MSFLKEPESFYNRKHCFIPLKFSDLKDGLVKLLRNFRCLGIRTLKKKIKTFVYVSNNIQMIYLQCTMFDDKITLSLKIVK